MKEWERREIRLILSTINSHVSNGNEFYARWSISRWKVTVEEEKISSKSVPSGNFKENEYPKSGERFTDGCTDTRNGEKGEREEKEVEEEDGTRSGVSAFGWKLMNRFGVRKWKYDGVENSWQRGQRKSCRRNIIPTERWRKMRNRTCGIKEREGIGGGMKYISHSFRHLHHPWPFSLSAAVLFSNLYFNFKHAYPRHGFKIEASRVLLIKALSPSSSPLPRLIQWLQRGRTFSAAITKLCNLSRPL